MYISCFIVAVNLNSVDFDKCDQLNAYEVILSAVFTLELCVNVVLDMSLTY